MIGRGSALAGQDDDDDDDDAHLAGEPLHLPLPPSSEDRRALDVSGEGSRTRLEELGPMVVQPDGSLGRIGNWSDFTQEQRETIAGVITKRNRARLRALQDKQSANPSSPTSVVSSSERP